MVQDYYSYKNHKIKWASNYTFTQSLYNNLPENYSYYGMFTFNWYNMFRADRDTNPLDGAKIVSPAKGPFYSGEELERAKPDARANLLSQHIGSYISGFTGLDHDSRQVGGGLISDGAGGLKDNGSGKDQFIDILKWGHGITRTPFQEDSLYQMVVSSDIIGTGEGKWHLTLSTQITGKERTRTKIDPLYGDYGVFSYIIYIPKGAGDVSLTLEPNVTNKGTHIDLMKFVFDIRYFSKIVESPDETTYLTLKAHHTDFTKNPSLDKFIQHIDSQDYDFSFNVVPSTSTIVSKYGETGDFLKYTCGDYQYNPSGGNQKLARELVNISTTYDVLGHPNNVVELNASGFDKLKRGDFTELKQKISAINGNGNADSSWEPPLIVYEGYVKKAVLLNRIINTPSIMYTMNITMRSTNRKIEYTVNDRNTIYINNDAFMFDLWNVDSQIYWRVPVELIQANPSVFGKKFTLSNFGHGTGGTDLPVTLTSVSGNSATFSSAIGNSKMPDGSTVFIRSGIDGRGRDNGDFYGFEHSTFHPSGSSSLKHNAPYTDTNALDFVSAGLPMYSPGQSYYTNDSGLYANSVASLLHNQYDQKKKTTSDKNTLNKNITNTSTKASDDVFNFYVASPPFSNYSAVERALVTTTLSVINSNRNKKIWKPKNFSQFGGIITDVERGVAINLDMIPLIMQDLNNGIIQYYFAHGRLYHRTLQTKDGSSIKALYDGVGKDKLEKTNIVKSTLLTGSTGDSEVFYINPENGKDDHESSYDTISFKLDTSQNSSVTTIFDTKNVIVGFFLKGRKYHRYPNNGKYTDTYWYTDKHNANFHSITFDDRDNTLELVDNVRLNMVGYDTVATNADRYDSLRGYGLFYTHIPDYPSHSWAPTMDQPNSRYAGKIDFSNGETKVVNIECAYIPDYGNRPSRNETGLTIFQYLDDLYNNPTKFSVRRAKPTYPPKIEISGYNQADAKLANKGSYGKKTETYLFVNENGPTYNEGINFSTNVDHFPGGHTNVHGNTMLIDVNALNSLFGGINISATNLDTYIIGYNAASMLSEFLYNSDLSKVADEFRYSQYPFLESYVTSSTLVSGSTPEDITVKLNFQGDFPSYTSYNAGNGYAQNIDYYDAHSDNFFKTNITGDATDDPISYHLSIRSDIHYYIGYEFSSTPPTGLITPPSGNFKHFTTSGYQNSVQLKGPWKQNATVSSLADSYLTLRLYVGIPNSIYNVDEDSYEKVPVNPQGATNPMDFQTTIKIPGSAGQIEILPDTAILVNQRGMSTFVGNGTADHINSPTNYFIRFPIKDYDTNTSKYKDYVKYTNTVKYDASKPNKESFSGKKANMVWYGINYFTHKIEDIATAPAQIITNDIYIHDGFVYTVNKEDGISLDGHTLFYFKLMDAQSNDVIYQSPIYYEAMTLSKFGTGTHFIAMRYPYELVKYAEGSFGRKFSISHMVNGESNKDIWVSINDLNSKTRTITEGDGEESYTINQTYREYTVTASGVGSPNDEDALDLNTLRIGGTVVPNRVETDGNYFIINERPVDGSVTSVLEEATDPNAGVHSYRVNTSIINEDYDNLVDEVYSNFVSNYSEVSNGSNTVIEDVSDPDNNTVSMFVTYGVFDRGAVYNNLDKNMGTTDYRTFEDTTGTMLTQGELGAAFGGSPFVDSTNSQFPNVPGKKLDVTANTTISTRIELRPDGAANITNGNNTAFRRFIVILFKTNNPDFVVSNLLPKITTDKLFSVKTKDSLMFAVAPVPTTGGIVLFDSGIVIPAGTSIEIVGLNIVGADKLNNAVYSAFYRNLYANTSLKYPRTSDRFHFFKPETLTISARGNTSGSIFSELTTNSGYGKWFSVPQESEDYTISIKAPSTYDLSALVINTDFKFGDLNRRNSFAYGGGRNPIAITSKIAGNMGDDYYTDHITNGDLTTVQSFVPNTPYSTLMKVYTTDDTKKTLAIKMYNVRTARIPGPMVTAVMNIPPIVYEQEYNSMPTVPKSTGALEILEGSKPTVYIHDFLEYSTINPDVAAIVPPVEVLTAGPEVDKITKSEEGYDIISMKKSGKSPVPKIRNVVIPEMPGNIIPFGISSTVTNNTRKEIMFTPNTEGSEDVPPSRYPTNPFGQETILNDLGTYEITTQYDMQEVRMARLGTLGTKISSPEYKVKIDYFKEDSLGGVVPPVIETVQNVGNKVTVNITFDKDNVEDHYHYTGWIIKDGGTPQVLFDNDSTINNAPTLTRTYGPYTADGSYEVLVEYNTDVNTTKQYVSKDFIIDSNMQHGESGNYNVPNDPDNIPLAKDYPFPANWWAHDSYADDINAYANDVVYKPVRANKNTNPYNYGLTTISIFGHKYAYMEKDPIINYNIFENGTFNFNTYTLENPTYTSHIHGIGESYIINGTSWKTDGMGSLSTNDFDITKDASRHLHPYTSKPTDSVHTDHITLLDQTRPRVPEYVASSDTALPPFKSHDVMPLAATDDIKFRLTNKSKGYDVYLFIDGYPYTEGSVYRDPGTHYFFAIYKDKHNYLASYSQPQKFIIEKEHRYSPPYIDYTPKKQYSEFYDVTIDYFYYDSQLGIRDEENDLDELSRPRVKSKLYKLGDNDTWHNYTGPFRITKPVRITARKVYTDNFFFDVYLDIDMNKINYNLPKVPAISDISQPNVNGGGLAVYIPTVEKKLGFSYREWLNGVPYTAGTPVTNYERNRRHFWYTVEITDNMTQEKNRITKHFDIDTRTPERPRLSGLVQGMIKRVDPSYKLSLLNRESGVTYKYQINGQALDITKPLGDYANGRFDKVYKIIAQATRTDNGMTNTSYYYIEVNQAIDDRLYNSGRTELNGNSIAPGNLEYGRNILIPYNRDSKLYEYPGELVVDRRTGDLSVVSDIPDSKTGFKIVDVTNNISMMLRVSGNVLGNLEKVIPFLNEKTRWLSDSMDYISKNTDWLKDLYNDLDHKINELYNRLKALDSAADANGRDIEAMGTVVKNYHSIIMNGEFKQAYDQLNGPIRQQLPVLRASYIELLTRYFEIASVESQIDFNLRDIENLMRTKLTGGKFLQYEASFITTLESLSNQFKKDVSGGWKDPKDYGFRI